MGGNNPERAALVCRASGFSFRASSLKPIPPRTLASPAEAILTLRKITKVSVIIGIAVYSQHT